MYFCLHSEDWKQTEVLSYFMIETEFHYFMCEYTIRIWNTNGKIMCWQIRTVIVSKSQMLLQNIGTCGIYEVTSEDNRDLKSVQKSKWGLLSKYKVLNVFPFFSPPYVKCPLGSSTTVMVAIAYSFSAKSVRKSWINEIGESQRLVRLVKSWLVPQGGDAISHCMCA